MTTFDFSPGAQVPLTDVAKQTAATQALSSAAYRDGSMEELTKLSEGTGQKAGRFSLLEPNLGEAFSRAVQARMLGKGRDPVIQSFGVDPAAVVQHCLTASRIRRSRDVRLTVVMLVFGLVFLPGTLVWIGAFQLRRTLSRLSGSRLTPLGGVVIAAVWVFAVLFALVPPFTGVAQLYVRLMLLAPVAGWFLAKRICSATAMELRKRWTGALEGAGAGPSIPETVPSGPNDTRAESLRVEMEKLAAEQNSNVVFYRGRDGILGMGPRWGSWVMAEELTPKEGSDINQFRSWDVVRAIHGALRDLERSPLHSGGFPRPTVRHWIVVPIAEGAGGVSRPSGPEVDGYSIRDFEIQRICNEQQFGSGNRHYLGVQFVLWEGQLVLNLLCTVTVLHRTLRVEVTGHTLGPVAPSLSSKPSPKTRDIPKKGKFWETRTITLPLVTAEEVVRCAVRAPLMWIPGLLEWAGGKLSLPEPFGLRHSWVEPPWTHRFMADDALRAATPVVRAVHAATIKVLEDNNVDTDKFTSRSLNLGGAVQGATPGRADAYDAG